MVVNQTNKPEKSENGGVNLRWSWKREGKAVRSCFSHNKQASRRRIAAEYELGRPRHQPEQSQLFSFQHLFSKAPTLFHINPPSCHSKLLWSCSSILLPWVSMTLLTLCPQCRQQRKQSQWRLHVRWELYPIPTQQHRLTIVVADQLGGKLRSMPWASFIAWRCAHTHSRRLVWWVWAARALRCYRPLLRTLVAFFPVCIVLKSMAHRIWAPVSRLPG